MDARRNANPGSADVLVRRRNAAGAGRAPWGAVGLLGFLLALAGGAAAGEPPLAPPRPQRGDHTLLSWREGPPYFTTSRYSSERRFLRLETGHFAAEFDTERIALTGFASWPEERAEAAATQSALAGAPLPPAQLDLVVRVGATAFACVGRVPLALDAHGLPAEPLTFPVRVIESGRIFQKFALHELEFKDDAGRRLPAVVWLEVAAWPDRLILTLHLRPDEALAGARTFLRVRSAGGTDASYAEDPRDWPAGREHRATLALAADGAAVAPAAPAGVGVTATAVGPGARATVRWNPDERAHQLRLEGAPWPAPAEGVYPESKFGAWEAYDLTLENHAGGEQRVALGFEHVPTRSITGFVPMLLDADGSPSGLPLQVSKNWHRVREGVELPHAGHWMHGRTVVHLPPRSRVRLRHGTTYSHWGGVPTASLAQLSLAGWGHNGFWEQFALGSFGESFCFQPARVMRRALLTDLRPLFQRGFTRDERWGWPSNLGGGDTLVRYDPQGRYVPGKRQVTRHVSHGPNLAQLDYEELSADEAVRSRVSVFLPQADDHVRVYLRLRYDVLRRVEFSRLALFQLGAEHYNDADATRVAWGDAAGLVAEHGPEPGAAALPDWAARGEAAWISLHGQARRDADRAGQGTRGLIVRGWSATLGGRPVAAPVFAATRSRSGRGPLGAEVRAPAELTALEAGDRVDLWLEVVVFPLTVERYYGPDGAFRRALAEGANTWRLVQREATENRPVLRGPRGGPRASAGEFPLQVPVAADDSAAFSIAGGLGWLPLRITGLPRPDAVELHRVGRGGSEPVGRGDAERVARQADFDPATGQWSVTYTVPAAAETVTDYEVRPGTAALAGVREKQ
ncbi:MAG: hypothetical protein JNL92_22265 [Opitutaceae bacterium]|nr:hypothetical protein [Opitutaceae bacterium]